MAKFIMANRRAGIYNDDAKKRSRESLDLSFQKHFESSVDLLGDHSLDGEKSRRTIVFHGEAGEVAAKAKEMPGSVIVEYERPRHPSIAFPRDVARARTLLDTDTIPAGTGATLSIQVRGSGESVAGVLGMLILRYYGDYATKIQTLSGSDGRLAFQYSPFWRPSILLLIPTTGGYWSRMVRGPFDGQIVDFDALPAKGPLGWWHKSMGIDSFDANRGEGIRIGIVDTGAGPNPAIAHVKDVGTFRNGNHDTAAGSGKDTQGHGSHVAGILGARPLAEGQYGGIVPGAELFSACVFPENSGAHQGDIANAIDFLSHESQCDLINLSLGSTEESEIEHDAIQDALERGSLCIAAAGNNGVEGAEFPALYPEVVSVGAVGLEGWGFGGTFADLSYPDIPERYGLDGHYLAAFSNWGQLNCCAPGAGIISTIPNRSADPSVAPYVDMAGTSMASPAATGALAAVLARSDYYKQLSRDSGRSEVARAHLRRHSRDMGLDRKYQGFGLMGVR